MPGGMSAGTAAILAAGSAAAAGIGAGATAVKNKKSYKYTKKLNDELYKRQLERDARAQEYAKELSDYEYEKNLAQWHRENEYNTPQAQMQRFKEAGLNPHLIYGDKNLASSSPNYNAHQADLSQPQMHNFQLENTAQEWMQLGNVISNYQSYLNTSEVIEGQRLDNVNKVISNNDNRTLFRSNILDLFNKMAQSDTFVDYAGYLYNNSKGVENIDSLDSDMKQLFKNLKSDKNIAYQLSLNQKVHNENLSVVSSFDRAMAETKTDLLKKALKKLNNGASLDKVFSEKFNTSMMLLNTMQQNSDVFSSHLPLIGTVGSGLKNVFKGIKSFWKNRKR